jgi:hypothetical protein
MRGSQPIREAIAAFLADPTVEEAFEAIELANRPYTIPAPMAGAHPDTAIAHEHYRMIGVTHAISAIRAFASAPGTHESENIIEGTEFTHKLPPELRERRKATA